MSNLPIFKKDSFKEFLTKISHLDTDVPNDLQFSVFIFKSHSTAGGYNFTCGFLNYKTSFDGHNYVYDFSSDINLGSDLELKYMIISIIMVIPRSKKYLLEDIAPNFGTEFRDVHENKFSIEPNIFQSSLKFKE
ncbi:14555_t:CDS:1, partial [Cetraspora pellucida]